MIKTKIIAHIFITTLLTVPMFVTAQCVNGNGIICPPVSGASDLMSLIVLILNNIVMPIGAVLCVMWIIYAGFKYVTAQGNEKKVSEAHKTLLWALVGTGVLLGAAGISRVIENTVRSVVNY